jgi:hypothetical protein
MFLKLHTSEITLIQIYSRIFFSHNRFYVLVEVVKAHIDGKIIVEQKQKEKKVNCCANKPTARTRGKGAINRQQNDLKSLRQLFAVSSS